MKKKYAVLALLTMGFTLFSASLIAAAILTVQADIIGGAGFPTFGYFLFHQHGGRYAALAFLGLALMIASVIVHLWKSKPG
jgi:hypothetical protein